MIEEREFNRLSEDFEELKQTYKSCEIEYKQIINSYNKIVEQNKIMQKALKTIKNMTNAELLNSVAVKRINEICNIV